MNKRAWSDNQISVKTYQRNVSCEWAQRQHPAYVVQGIRCIQTSKLVKEEICKFHTSNTIEWSIISLNLKLTLI